MGLGRPIVMPKRTKSSKKECTNCKKLFNREDLSHTGKCLNCTFDLMKEHITEMHEKDGPGWERYKKGVKKYADSLTKD